MYQEILKKNEAMIGWNAVSQIRMIKHRKNLSRTRNIVKQKGLDSLNRPFMK